MTVTSLLLGLDVSPRRLGWGLVNLLTGEPVAAGMEPLDLPSKGWHHQQVQRALGEINSVRHGFSVGNNDTGWTSVAEIQLVYAETTAKAGKYRQHDAGRAQGIVQAEVERRWPHAPIEWLAPAEWKSLAGVQTALDERALYNCPRPWPRPRELKLGPYVRAWELGFTPGESQDAADAACVAYAGWVRNAENWSRGVERGAA